MNNNDCVKIFSKFSFHILHEKKGGKLNAQFLSRFEYIDLKTTQITIYLIFIWIKELKFNMLAMVLSLILSFHAITLCACIIVYFNTIRVIYSYGLHSNEDLKAKTDQHTPFQTAIDPSGWDFGNHAFVWILQTQDGVCRSDRSVTWTIWQTIPVSYHFDD